MNIGPMELFLILGIVLLLFGSSRLPSLAKSVAESMRVFKKALNSNEEIDVTEKSKANAELKQNQENEAILKQKEKETHKS